MRRAFVLILLLTSLFWQSLSLAGQAGLFAQAQEREHALLHWQDSAHHHHDDGSFHEEASSDGVNHVVVDGALQAAGMLVVGLALPQATKPPIPLATPARASIPPLIDGPLRPPRAAA